MKALALFIVSIAMFGCSTEAELGGANGLATPPTAAPVQDGDAVGRPGSGEEIPGKAVIELISGGEVTGLQIEPNNPEVKVGSDLQLEAIASFERGSPREVSEFAKWSSSNSDVLEVNETGVVSGIKEGSVEITAEYRGKKARARVKICLLYTSPSPRDTG